MSAAQRQARSSLRTAIALAVTAALAAAVPGVERWVPLHLFLAGALVTAISGTMVLFAVTWAAGPAPASPLTTAQRLAVAGGACAVVAGRWSELRWLLAAGAAVYLCGLVTLGALVARTVARGVERRFDAAAVWYVAAVACGVAGGGLGAALGTGAADGWGGDVRAAHLVANLLGLAGLTVAGTLPSFAATQLRMRMSPRSTPRRSLALLAWQVGSLAAAGAGLLGGNRPAAAGGLFAYAAGLVALLAILPRPGRRQLRWAGPRIGHLAAAWAWLVASVVLAGWDAAAGRPVLDGAALVVLVVCGLGQLLWGSLAYLLPVLRAGGPERLGQGFATTRSWAGLIAANLAGAALLVGWEPAASALVAVWLLDAAARVVAVERRRGAGDGTAPQVAGVAR